MSFDERFQDTNERFQRLKNSFPFFKLYLYSRKKLPYDAAYLSIGVLTLLIEEGKLKTRPVPMEEIEKYIGTILPEIYSSSNYDIKEVTRSILELLETDTDGSTYLFEHINPIENVSQQYRVSLIKYNVSDKGYEITDYGLDFMISTKELPEESRITVGLILFRKQIENGSFTSALNTIQELNLNVLRKKDLKQELLKKMQYRQAGIAESYSKYAKSVNDQLIEEEELFRQVRESLDNIIDYSDGTELTNNPSLNLSKKDYDVLSKIDPELDYGYDLHSSLLKDFTSFKEESDKIMKSRIRSTFKREKWRFKETLESNIKMNRLNDAHVICMQPLILPKVPKHFSLLKIFEPQTVSRKKENIEEEPKKNEWKKSKLLDDQIEERQCNNFKVFSYCLMDNLLQKNDKSDLETYLKHVSDELGPDALYNIDLIPFLLELNNSHQDQTSSCCINTYQTSINLQNDVYKKENRDYATLSLLWACEELGMDKMTLIITSKPEKHVKICENKNIYITDMDFIIK